MKGPAEFALYAAYAEHNPGAAIRQDALDAVDSVVRALEITLRDAPGSATETLLRRWLDELALSHSVEPMPEGAFDGPVVGAELLSQASAAYWSCKLAQRGVRLAGGAS